MNYFDYAAATPVDQRVVKAMQPYLSEQFYNPSSVYLASRAVKDNIAQARLRVAHWLGARPSEIVFTAGATEANNLAIRGVLDKYPGSEVIVSAVEHEAVLEAADKPKLVTVNKYGQIELNQLASALSDKTAIVSVVYANNEVGTVQHLHDIAQVLETVRAKRRTLKSPLPLYLHTDASQAANYLDLHVSKLGVDLMTLNAGKMYGPKQVGVLYVRAGIVLHPQIKGGGQERGLRSGTENVAGIIGMAKALDIAQKSRKQETERLHKLRLTLLNGLESIDNVQLLGHKKHTLPNIINVLIDGVDGERLVMMLDEAGIQASTGSACSALRDESSHVIKALGFSEAQAQTSLRLSMGRFTTQEQVDDVLAKLPRLIKLARQI